MLQVVALILSRSISASFITSLRRSSPSLSIVSSSCTRPGSSLSMTDSSSYEVDGDEDLEQGLDSDVVINGSGQTAAIDAGGGGGGGGGGTSVVPSNVIMDGSAKSRYHPFLESLGLSDQLLQLENLPGRPQIANHDVFCNRELRLDALRAIGFDMDYTLAQYKQPAFDRLAFEGAKDKLVRVLGYPKEVLDFEYDHTFWARGLIMDIERGNFLKIDRHKYVRVARHGFEKISSTTRKYLYSRTFNKVRSFSESNFVNMDTLFQIVDAHLFAYLIELKDKGDHEVLDSKTYAEIYREVRRSVDLCHRDGVIKNEVALNPEKYIVFDKGFIPMLRQYREAGIKVFLLTNSYWEYTSVAMNYLFHGRKVDDDLKKKNEWLDLFDLAIVGSCKPAYMVDPNLNLFRVNPQDGSLLNTDGLFEIAAMGEGGAEQFLSQGKTFQGGNWQHLQAMLGVQAGEEILYVGDHLYADVLRSKRTLGWRSAFVMPELEEEMRVFERNRHVLGVITKLRLLRNELSAHADSVQRKKEEGWQRVIEEIDHDDRLIKGQLSALAERWHKSFHPIWGAMFNTGYQDSRFAFYVENYACLYTSRATNLGLSFKTRSFRTTSEMLPHDKILADETTNFVDYEPWDT